MQLFSKYKRLKSSEEVCWTKAVCVHGYFDGADTNILFVNVQIIASDLDTGHLPSRTAEDSGHFLSTD